MSYNGVYVAFNWETQSAYCPPFLASTKPPTGAIYYLSRTSRGGGRVLFVIADLLTRFIPLEMNLVTRIRNRRDIC